MEAKITVKTSIETVKLSIILRITNTKDYNTSNTNTKDLLYFFLLLRNGE